MDRSFPTLLVVLIAGIAAAGCGDNQVAQPQFGFAIAEDEPVAISDVPFPNDLFVDDDGQLSIHDSSLPFGSGADPELMPLIAAAFERLDCFAPGAGVILPLADVDDDDSIDPTSLTDAIALVDVASGTAYPIEWHIRDREKQLFVRPRRGTVLSPARTYAVIVKGGVSLTSGQAVSAAGDLAAVLDDAEPSSRLANAHRAYAPLRQYLADSDQTEVVGATVFTTCDYQADFDQIVAQLDDMDVPAVSLDRIWTAGSELDELLGLPDDNMFPGVDNPGGIAHSHLAYLIQGSFAAPNYLADTPGRLGMWDVDSAGQFVVKGTDSVTFLLAMPTGLASYADVPIVVFQHGLGESKTAVLAVANSMAQLGFASISIDIPFHGSRFPDGKDNRHNFTDAEGPDGLTDNTGALTAPVFFNILGDEGVAPLDPRVQADSFRQAAVDIMVLARVIDGGDLSAIGDAEPALVGLSFRSDRIVYASESFGGFIGSLALAFEPRYQAAFMSVAGGGLVSDLLENSPTYAGFFMPILGGAFDVAPNEVDPLYDPAHTHYAYQTMGLLLGAADPLNYSHRVRAKGVHVVMASAFADESVPNQSSEALAAAFGLPWIDVPGATSGPRYLDESAMTEDSLPIAGNVSVGDAALTLGYFELDPANHGMMTRGRGHRKYQPDFPPFVALAEEQTFDNPIVQLHDYLGQFAQSYLQTGQPAITTP